MERARNLKFGIRVADGVFGNMRNVLWNFVLKVNENTNV